MSRKHSIEEIRGYTKSKGGILLSSVYLNNKEQLLWKCSCGEEWESSWSYIKNKSTWCPKCSESKSKKYPNTYKIDFFKTLAISKGGKCLSDTYIHCNNKLKFQCDLGNIWETMPSTIINSETWCPICNHISPVTIGDMNKLADKKRGKCLSVKYINSGTKLLWECEKGHQWNAVPDSIVGGSWCPTCADTTIHSSISEMKLFAKTKNGDCLSEKYVSHNTKLMWECENKHQWMATPSNIKFGKWCPICRESGGEKLINKYLILNNINFIREKRFNDCKNKKTLPFDFYLLDYNICVEFDGHHHFKPVTFGGMSIEKANKAFLLSQVNDKIKTEYCVDSNINLIRIPYTMTNIEEYLTSELKLLNVIIK